MACCVADRSCEFSDDNGVEIRLDGNREGALLYYVREVRAFCRLWMMIRLENNRLKKEARNRVLYGVRY
ncbi:unnamed protein product [Calypogeia fissa]